MQPKSIQRFDIFYLGSIAVSVAGFFIGYDEAVRQMRTASAASGMEMGGGVISGFFLGVTAISVLLWYLISNRGNVIAKWVLVVLYVIFVLLTLLGIQTLLANLTLANGLSLLSLGLEGVAIYFLFLPDTKPWFEKDEKR